MLFLGNHSDLTPYNTNNNYEGLFMISPIHLKRLTLPLLLSIALAGCGGGSNFGDKSGTSSGTKPTETVKVAEVASLEISASSAVLLSQGEKSSVTISAIAKDKDNKVISNVPMRFFVDNYATIIANKDNDKASMKTATLLAGMNHPESRTLVVTVVAGKMKKTLTVKVDDSKIEIRNGDKVVKSLDVQVNSEKLYSLGSNEVTISVVAKNAANNVLAGIPIAFDVDNDGLIQPNGDNTQGIKTAKLTSGLGHPEARVLTVTITSGLLVKTLKVEVLKERDPSIEKDSKVTALEISASSRQLFSDGTKPVVISAIAKDENNNILSDAQVTFKINNQATINPDSANTGAAVKTAKITPGLNHPENRILEVEVLAGKLTKKLKVDIVGTRIILEGPEKIALDKVMDYSIKLQDSGKKPLAYHKLEIISKVGNEISTEASYISDTTGRMKFSLKPLHYGEDILTVKSLGTEATLKVIVSNNDFTLVNEDASESSEIKIKIPKKIKLTWVKDGVVQANQRIKLSATRGVLDPATDITTDDKGEASFTIKSDTAGMTVITATGADESIAILKQEFIAIKAHYLNTQASPAIIAPHGSSVLIAKIRDKNDNPVKNKHIVFNMDDRVNGILSNSRAKTDSLGRASVTYTASDVSSEKDGVLIKTYIEEDPTINDDIRLTVGGDALRLVIGYNSVLHIDDVFYKKHFGVIVTDSAGQPVEGQAIDVKITPLSYTKGTVFIAGGEDKGQVLKGRWAMKVAAECPTEDLNGNGQLDEGEDENKNGHLDPTNDATITVAGLTDKEGKLAVTVIYPQNQAWWTTHLITAKAVVKGTEFAEHTTFTLSLLAKAAKDVRVYPPNYAPVYGSSSDCSNPD